LEKCTVKSLVLLPLLILATAGVTVSPLVAGNYDGAWRVSVVSDPGCTDRYDVAVRVEDGTLHYESLIMSAFGSGTVSGSGRLTARIANVRIHGKLAGRTGSGRWNSPDCTGSWTARKA
jgi:hypothetical protein